MSVKKYDSTTKILKLIAGGTLFADAPIGIINGYGGATAPEGWMLCQGQAISRTEYADLFAVIGTNFGSGDGSTTFNLPDMREATLKGAGTTSKTVGAHNAVNVGDFVDDRIQDHTQSVTFNPAFNPVAMKSGGTYDVSWNTGIYNTALISGASASSITAGRHGDTTEVKAVGVNFIMKVKQSAMPANIAAEIEKILDERDYLTFGSGN